MAFPWLPVAIVASSLINAVASGGKNKPTENTSGLDPQGQQFRNMLGNYLQQQMQKPWLTAQPSMTTPNMLNMLYGTYFRTPQGQPQTFNMPGLMYGGSQFGQPYQGSSDIYSSSPTIRRKTSSGTTGSKGGKRSLADFAMGGLPYAAGKMMGEKNKNMAFGALPWLLGKMGI